MTKFEKDLQYCDKLEKLYTSELEKLKNEIESELPDYPIDSISSKIRFINYITEDAPNLGELIDKYQMLMFQKKILDVYYMNIDKKIHAREPIYTVDALYEHIKEESDPVAESVKEETNELKSNETTEKLPFAAPKLNGIEPFPTVKPIEVRGFIHIFNKDQLGNTDDYISVLDASKFTDKSTSFVRQILFAYDGVTAVDLIRHLQLRNCKIRGYIMGKKKVMISFDDFVNVWNTYLDYRHNSQ